MRKLSPTIQLKNRILLLESRKEAEWNLLKVQFKLTAEGLKPANIIKSMLNESASAPGLFEKALDAILAVAAGFIAKKIVAGDSKNIFKRIAGFIAQFLVTRTVAKNSEFIKTAGRNFVKGTYAKYKVPA